MAHNDKILEHRTNCPHCEHKWNSELLVNLMEDQGKQSLNLQCLCGNRIVIRENVNGWLVMYKYKTRVRK